MLTFWRFLGHLLVMWFVCDAKNIIFVLTDDQDVYLNSLTSMTEIKKYFSQTGITFENMFVCSPLCCPSRASILTGRYVHNHGIVNNSVSGNCSSFNWQRQEEPFAFPVYLKQAGYSTFFAGKYLNQYGRERTGGVQHVPPGWDEWHGLVGNSVYYNYTLSVNGRAEKHGEDYAADYLTDLIGRRARRFLGNVRQPFFMMLSTPACHAPFTAAPQYSYNFSHVRAPRTPNFNVRATDKHWLIRQTTIPMATESMEWVDETQRRRWRTLLSVQDVVMSVFKRLEELDLASSTYIFLTSDNGFHLGQFGLPNDKRQMYEFDVRVPLLVSGPGITSIILRNPVMNIDLAPTFLDIAGVSPNVANMDGRSFAHLLTESDNQKQSYNTDNFVQHMHQKSDGRHFLIEHSGEHRIYNRGCPQFNRQKMANCFPDCVCEDSKNNTYSCVRSITVSENSKYCEFLDSKKFKEAYDLNEDPHELRNIASRASKEWLEQKHKQLQALISCSGRTCQ